ncbi:MAG: SPOR domain-containing protein [bacterium]
MPEKDKTPKKTLTDELLEDNFFKPPIEDVLEESSVEEVKTPSKEAEKDEGEKSDLLFEEDFLKSPTEISPEPTVEQIKDTASLSSVEQPRTVQPSTPQVLVATDTGRAGNKLKIVIATLSGVLALLIVGLVYVYLHYSKLKPKEVVVVGAQHVEIQHPEEGVTKTAPIEQKPAEQSQPPQQPQPPQQSQPATPGKVAEQASTPQLSNKQITENIPPVAAPQPVTELTKQYEVILEGIKSKRMLNNAKHIGETINNSLKFDVTENKKSIPMYSLFVDKIYPSEGEATADNLKLMVVNISNASIIKADGGYRILIGKYDSKAKAMSKINDIKSAGLEGLVKETPNIVLTYDLKVYPFKSAKEAELYQTRVKTFAAKVTFEEVK